VPEPIAPNDEGCAVKVERQLNAKQSVEKRKETPKLNNNLTTKALFLFQAENECLDS
jgi:hypothetical protein